VRAVLALLAAVFVLSFEGVAPAQSSGETFGDWAAVVVAGDWRANNGKPTAAFENARRDVAATLVRSGFSPANVKTLGLAAADPAERQATGSNLEAALRDTTLRARGGCLFYVTSHGSPAGVVFGRDNHVLAPRVLDRLLQDACAERPTIVFVSACYSGVFVPALAAPNRMVLTAARPDRSSFGCGEDDVYPFFDDCVLQAWPRSADFLALAAQVRGCVARRERELQLQPASEPQLYAGGQIRALLPLLQLPAARRPAA
jgi:hypothetical protein